MRLIDADALLEAIDNEGFDKMRSAQGLGKRPSWAEHYDEVITIYQVEQFIENAPTIEPNLVLNPDEVKRGDVVEIGENIVVMHHDDYYDMFLKSELYDDIKPCEDAISREALIDAHYEYLNEHSYECPEFQGWSLELMKNAPPVAPSGQSGEWIDCGSYYKCPFCEEIELESDGKTNFCPNCGAKMKGADTVG